MDEKLLDIHCPNCKNTLLEALVNPFYLFSGTCPYCQVEIRLALFPVLLLLFGSALAGAAPYIPLGSFFALSPAVPVTLALISSGIIIAGLGILLLHFNLVTRRSSLKPTHTRSYYPYS